MPRTNLGRNLANEHLIATIWGAKTVAGLTEGEFADALGMSRSTLIEHRKHPEKFTLGDLRRIGHVLNIPIETLRDAIRY